MLQLVIAMPYQRATIYVMSGTGNSHRAATWVAEDAAASGAEARVVPLDQARPAEEVQAGSANLVGLIFPTHGFTAPWAVIRFALRLPRRRGTHALVMPTRAGSHIGAWFTPGLEGTAAYLIALILVLKGYDIRGVQALDMPSNWIAVHPALLPSTVDGILARARPRVASLMQRVLAGERVLRGWVPLFCGLLLLPISLAYLLMGRFGLAKLFFANERCNGCGVCVKNCPHNALRMWGRKKPRPYWTFSCETCMRCMNYCPEKAIEAGHSWGVLLYFVMTFPVVDWLVHRLAGLLPWLSQVYSTAVGFWVLEYPYKLLSIFVAYLLFTLLVRVPLINRLFTVTTLTHYYRRYHEPGTRLRDLRGK
jgi:Pyruvate/2-oxoacid:ferredoxin oxidoreductase delta subunit